MTLITSAAVPPRASARAAAAAAEAAAATTTDPHFVLTDPPPPPSRPLSPSAYRSSPHARAARAVVLDLGSSSLRAGFSTMSHPALSVPPCVARLRDPDTGLRTFLIGHEALVSSARSTARPAYEAAIPNNPALMERLLDGALAGLGLADEDHIPHRFLVTEAPCQPNSARALIQELLFEAYLTPALCFGVDALFSYFHNRHTRVLTSSSSSSFSSSSPTVVGSGGSLRYARDNALILSCGYANTHVLPLCAGRLHPPAIKRVNIGGMHMTDQLTRRLQLLHNDHAPALSTARVEALKERACYVARHYDADLTRLNVDADFYAALTRRVRIPSGDAADDKPKPSPEEQERQRQARIENGRRLSEMMKERNRRRAAENRAADAAEKKAGAEGQDASYTPEEVQPLHDALKHWYELQRIDQMREFDEDKFYIALEVKNFASSTAFAEQLAQREAALQDCRAALPDAKCAAAEEAWWKRELEDELLSMSDSELSAADLKRKRHVRALRGAAEARIRAKRAKEAEKAEEERKVEELRKMREERPQEYLKQLRDERDALAEKIKKRTAARAAGSDRRSQAARERMRLLAQHAGNRASADEPTRGRGRNRGRGGRSGGGGGGGGGAGEGSEGGGSGSGAAGAGGGGGGSARAAKGKGKGRGKGGRSGKKKGGGDEDDDNFGWNDSDWDVYRSMKVGQESDSEDNSGEERERLEKVRGEIAEMAPEEVDPTVSRPEGLALVFEDKRAPDEVWVTVDRARTGEILFQPTLAGVEQCGLMEAVELSLNTLACSSGGSGGSEARDDIVKEVFLTGGVAGMQGLRQRVCDELRCMLPTEIGDEVEAGVRVAKDPGGDAWRGAALFAQHGGDDFDRACVTKQEYEEMGNGYMREHAFGNVFYPTPILSAADLELKKKMAKQASKRGRPRGLLS